MDFRMRSIFVLILHIFIFNQIRCDCVIDITKLSTSSAKEPLFLSGTLNDDLRFKIPENGFLRFANYENLFVSCPKTALFSTKCINGNFQPEPPLSCTYAQSPTARLISKNSCGPTMLGSEYEIGYQVPNLKFLSLTTICKNDNTDSTYYVRHNVFNVNRSMKNERFSTWDMFGLNARLTQQFIEENYKKINQKKYFESIGLLTTDFLAKGHLNSCADHPFQSWNKATFFYLNHVPQWQLLNQGVWIKVENYVRTLSSNEDLLIYTGGLGQYSVNAQPLYIVDNNRRVEVPRFIWKLVIAQNESLAFVIMNTKTDNVRDPNMCDDRDQDCKINGFIDYINVKGAGFLSCCSEKELYKMMRRKDWIKMA